METTLESDSHADTTVLGRGCLKLSQLTTAITSMTVTLEALATLSAKHDRNIKQIRAIQQDDDEEDLFEDSSSEEEVTNTNNPALARNRTKTHPKGIMKKRQKR